MTAQNERIISLTVSAHGAEEWFDTFKEITGLSLLLGRHHRHVSVSCTTVGEDDEIEPDRENLYYDEYTLLKALNAIRRVGLTSESAENIVNAMLNDGLLFRERTTSND